MDSQKHYYLKTNNWSLTILLVTLSISIFVCLNVQQQFEYLPFLAITATILINLFIYPLFIKSKSSTVLFFLICVFLKYLITPLLYSIAPILSFSRYTPKDFSNINSGILLMIYELVIVTFFIVFFVNQIKNKDGNSFQELNSHPFEDNRAFLKLYVFITILLVLFIPNSTKGLSFFALDANTGIRVSSDGLSSSGILLREFVLFGIFSSFILFSMWCSKKYYHSNNKLYVLSALLFGIVISMIIVSEARSSQIYTGYAAFVLLSFLFPQSKKGIRALLLSAIAIVILLLSVYKTFYAFSYDSYISALSAANVQLDTFTTNAEIYFLGPLHYCSIIELAASGQSFGPLRFIFGLLRSVMGTNILVKNLSWQTTNMVFNSFVTDGAATTGYLLPITGLGLLYFNTLLSPAITVFIYFCAVKVEQIIKRSRSAFVAFFLAYIYIRLATCLICTNLNTILTHSSMVFWVAGVIYLINERKITVKKNSYAWKSFPEDDNC